MITAFLVLLAVILIGCIGLTCYGVLNGCPFAWVSMACGGLTHLGGLLATVLGELFNGLGE